MRLILCKECKQPLIEDIGDIKKCKTCIKRTKCSTHKYFCNKCRLGRDCSKPEEKECLGCKELFNTNSKNPPNQRCSACHIRSGCVIIDLFCKDCLDIIHYKTYGVEGFIASFSKERQKAISKKIKEYREEKKRSNLLSDIDDVEI